MNFIDYKKTILLNKYSLTSSDLISAAKETNKYIMNLVEIFSNIEFDIFYSLGERNVSGFVGEIYKNILASQHSVLITNPHPDGRPDILNLASSGAQNYYEKCFEEINDRKNPIKSMLAPFKYGGLEVKCSVGTLDEKKSKDFISKNGHPFSVYDSRVGYLNNINWWGHHVSEIDLLGLYCDYYEALGGAPQILAGCYAKLYSDDWRALSTGNPNKKKTSNTSLNKYGLKKMRNNCMFCVEDLDYQEQVKKMHIVL